MAWLALRGLGGKKIDDLQSWNVSRERRSDEMLSGIYAEGWPFIIIFGIGAGNPTTTVSGVDSIYNFIYPIGYSCRPEWRYAVLSHLLEMDKIYCEVFVTGDFDARLSGDLHSERRRVFPILLNGRTYELLDLPPHFFLLTGLFKLLVLIVMVREIVNISGKAVNPSFYHGSAPWSVWWNFVFLFG